MGKRFTDVAKWTDKWFRALSPDHKLAWGYLCDNCDAAGVIDLDPELADFQVGKAIDWQDFFVTAAARVERLARDKIWLTGFISFQYGKLSWECKPHRPIFALLEKHDLSERVLSGYSGGINTAQDKTIQEKDKDKKEEGSGEKPTRSIFVPPTEAQVSEYCTERKNKIDPAYFVDSYQKQGWKLSNGQKMTDWKAAVRYWERDRRNQRGSPAKESQSDTWLRKMQEKESAQPNNN